MDVSAASTLERLYTSFLLLPGYYYANFLHKTTRYTPMISIHNYNLSFAVVVFVNLFVHGGERVPVVAKHIPLQKRPKRLIARA